MKNETPVGLIAVQDLLERHPIERERLLAYEIAHRERERLLYRGTRKLLHFHLWGSLKTMVSIGLTVFFLVWLAGQAAQIAKWFQTIQNYSLRIPVPLRQHFVWSVRQVVPTSTAIEVLAAWPKFDWHDALLAAAIVMGVVLLEQGILAWLTWRHVSELRAAETQTEDEIRALKGWAEEGRVASRKKDAPL